ncbi:MAG: hypothetical protein FWG64_06960 [Firmicutes bacterium]|nr:hypothetical protein [Bacillota bacterium]
MLTESVGIILIASVALMLISLLLLFLFLGLWTYNDAKVKSDKSPGLWVLLVLLVPNFLGFICYLLIGRTKKESAPGLYKIPLIVSGVFFAFTLVFAIVATIIFAFNDVDMSRQTEFVGFSTGSSEDAFGNARSGNFRNLRTSQGNQDWQVSVGSGNGFLQISPQIGTGESVALSVSGNLTAGNAFLHLEQDGTINIIAIHDLVENTEQFIFQTGQIRMQVYFEQAENVELQVFWNDLE